VKASILATVGVGALTFAGAVSLRRRYHADLAVAHRRLENPGVQVAQTERADPVRDPRYRRPGPGAAGSKAALLAQHADVLAVDSEVEGETPEDAS
jgi:hypothetical protein